MLVGCTEHARAFCRVNIAELRRSAPTVFSFLMVISLLLADGLFPVFASKYRSQASYYISNHLGQTSSSSGGGGGGSSSSSDGVLLSRSANSGNIRYRTKVRAKSFMSKRASVMNSGIDSRHSKLMVSRLYSPIYGHEVDARKGESDRRNERGIIEKKNKESKLQDYEVLSSRGGESSAVSGLPLLPSSLLASPSSGTSLKSFSSLPSSSSLTSASFTVSNSSNNIVKDTKPFSFINSGFDSNELSSSTCPEEEPTSSPSEETCSSIEKAKQCLVLTPARASIICKKCPRQDRKLIIRHTQLRFCTPYHPYTRCANNTSSGMDCPLYDTQECLEYLTNIIAIDKFVEKSYDGFLELIGRYDCNSNYSVKWQCKHCKQAYRDWLCSQKLTFYQSGQALPPCAEFCSHVEEMCPFFRPKLDSYAGDHSFICKDPHMNLPRDISEANCYGPCHLWLPADIARFYCPQHIANINECHLLQKCTTHYETNSQSNHSNMNNSLTSGSNSLYTASLTFTVSFITLHMLFLVLTSILRLPLTLTESQYFPKGLT